jgi:hypothetical protein
LLLAAAVEVVEIGPEVAVLVAFYQAHFLLLSARIRCWLVQAG